MNETFSLVVLLVPCLVFAIVFHEVAHGYVAKLLGDPTASELGRLTLNPIPHISPVGTLLVPGVLAMAGGPVFGWAKPVPVMKSRLSNPRFGMMAVAAAGPLSNFLLAVFAAVGFGLATSNGADFGTGSLFFVAPGGEILWLMSGLYLFLLVNVFLGLFNLLPIPPFDGSHIVGGLLPSAIRPHWERLQRFGIVLIIGVIAYSWMFGAGWLTNVLSTPFSLAMQAYIGIAREVSLLV